MRSQFEQEFYYALMGLGSAEEAARLLWECARAKEPWAIQLLLQRIAPQDSRMTLEVAHEETNRTDLSKLNEEQLLQLKHLLTLAGSEPLALPPGSATPT